MRLVWRRGSTLRTALRHNAALSAWPFVVVILLQMLVSGFSVYTLSAIRAFVTGESLWSKGQHEAVYFLDRYLESGNRIYLQEFDHSIAVPLSYLHGRQSIERSPSDPAATKRDFVAGGSAAADVPSVLWMFKNFRGFPYLEQAIAKWKEADKYILALRDLGSSLETSGQVADPKDLSKRVENIDAALTPRTIAFSRALDDGARLVERILLLTNFTLALVLAAITIWRVAKVSRQRRAFEDALAWQASHDELTGLNNRRAFEKRLNEVLKPTKKAASEPCALLFLDLDQFKIINDTCGHATGDAMLRRVGPPIQALLGADDILARLGGDEFGIMLPNVGAKEAIRIAEAIRVAVEAIDFRWQGHAFAVTASIGLVHDRPLFVSPEEMMSRADMACFMAKEKGRNRVHTHRLDDQELRGRVREMNWVQRIQAALAEERFCLYAQEIVALSPHRGDGVHLEVLIRMRDEAGTLIPPSSFLPAAERFGLIKLIDRWVVEQTFATLAARHQTGQGEPITCCGINLSGATVGDDGFLDFLKTLFARYAIVPATICFEITETVAIVSLDAARAFMRDLGALGCSFALDDFGSGMSSFTYLRELPVDFLKIDGAFVKNVLVERSDRAMVEMINHVGHVMGKQIVAEFVETDAVTDVLRAIGIDFVQGYGIAEPVPFTVAFGASARGITERRDRTQRLIA